MANRRLAESELILNPDGSIYHLNLKPEDLADTIITVGDPDRVKKVSKYFDKIELEVQKREFVTHTGYVGNKRISVISTGIGPDNIDIVFNELDALANIDFQSRKIKNEFKPLQFIRIGTSGSLQADVPVDSFLFSSAAIGLDNLFAFYQQADTDPLGISKALYQHLDSESNFSPAVWGFPASTELIEKIGRQQLQGITVTCPGFYAPQGRALRLASRIDERFMNALASFKYQDMRITNFEMETAAIYGMSYLLGHKALSCNAILANRVNKDFSKDPKGLVDRLIKSVLEKISDEA